MLKSLRVNQLIYAIFTRKTTKLRFPVLINTLFKVGSDTRIDHSVGLVHQKINESWFIGCHKEIASLACGSLAMTFSGPQ